MPDSPSNPRFDDESLSPQMLRTLEDNIRAAKGYVVPSENLRPKTLLKARECWLDKLSHRRFYRWVASLSMALVALVYLVQGLSILSSSIPPMDSEEMQSQALRSMEQQNISVDWALQQEYSRYRSQQATHLEASLFQPLAPDNSK
jgi:hypothetical protein